jgi:hypothetical protein
VDLATARGRARSTHATPVPTENLVVADDLITTGVLRRVLAFTELKFSNSMIEAWWRSLHKNINGSSSTRWTASPRSVDWSNSTCRNTTGCCHTRRFADRRLTKCTSVQGTRFPPDLTSRAVAAHRARVEANRSAACGASHPSTRPPDDRQLTAVRPPGPADSFVWRRLPVRREPAVVRVDGQNRVRDQHRSPVAAPCRLNDENSRRKVQNVHGDSSAASETRPVSTDATV